MAAKVDEEETVSVVRSTQKRPSRPRPSILRALIRFRLDEHETPEPAMLRRVERFLERALEAQDALEKEENLAVETAHEGISEEERTEPFARSDRLR